MAGVLEGQLAMALDRRLAVFLAKAEDGSLAGDEVLLRHCAFIAEEIILPCCCALASKDKLRSLLMLTRLCAGREELAGRLAAVIYDDLSRLNGLG